MSGTSRSTLKFKFSAPTGKKIKALRFALPSGLSIAAKKVAKNQTLKGTTTAKLSGARTIEGRVSAAGVTTYTVTIPKGAVALTAKAKKKKSFSVSARAGYTDGTRDTAKLTFKR